MKFKISILQILLVVLQPLVISVEGQSLLRDFLSYDVSQVNLTKLCANETQKLKKAIDENEILALKVIDASAQKSQGFFMGNNYLFGSQSACERLNDPPEIILIKDDSRIMNLNTTKIKAEFDVKYQMIYFSHKSPIQFNANIFNRSILHVGLCLPKSCDSNDIKYLSNNLMNSSFNNEKMFGEVKYFRSKVLELRPRLMMTNIFVIIFV